MKRLSRSSIEYLDYVWNFASGCLHGGTGVCPVGDLCWARKTTERFKAHYPKGFEPTIYPEARLSPLRLKSPATIGVCFMGDLFGDWVNPETQVLFEDGYNSLKQYLHFVLKSCPQHTFIFLTKAPWNLERWGSWPDNAWVGASICIDWMVPRTIDNLCGIQAGCKWLSIEPMLSWTALTGYDFARAGISWLVIGALTGSRKDMEAARVKWPELTLMPFGPKWSLQPPVSWVQEIVEAAEKAGVKIWLKNNVVPGLMRGESSLFPRWARRAGPGLRQALPSDLSLPGAGGS
ncbi:MAG: DUF5131 family protein [Dehalococcoidia bacterium]|nr:DUF5131 family protein [Dehalococcoidia bacterium]